MIFLILNFILTLFFILETIYVDTIENRYADGTNPIISDILLIGITVGLFSLFSLTNDFVTASLFTTMMKICFLLEACMLINIAFCFPYYAWKYSNGLIVAIKLIFYGLALWIVFFKFEQIKAGIFTGIVIKSDYLFSGAARGYFPWTWETVYNFIFRYMLPGFLCLVMLAYNEMHATKLEKYKGYVYSLALLSMWLMTYLLKRISGVYGGYSLMHFTVYIPLFVIIPVGSRLVSAPSGKRQASFLLKIFALYIIPAAMFGVIFVFLYQFAKENKFLFSVVAVLGTGFVLWLVTTISEKIRKSKFGHSSDYASAFEKDLAAVDYNGEMDEIANNMFNIFNKNTECSSMSVYINGGNSTFEPAYSSAGDKKNLTGLDRLFDFLLNIDKNVVIHRELESLHVLSSIKDDLEKFFIDTKSDALFIFNEGRDVHGFILLGIKTNKEHYKEYDLKAFTKLYSYFFVFGYYMRNISNKEIIGTVNRELRMSSQIITSIQENIDVLNNPKMDAGCIMIPAHNIGGEFVDMIRLNATRHLFVVGDLIGKGIAASMSMVILKAIIRAYLAETHDFKKLVVKVNSFIRNNLQKGTIFSGMFAIVNFENDTMYYINCGIPTVFLYTQAYNNVIEIQGGGHYLGFVSDISPYIKVKQIKLNKNDIILTCTNGIIESHSLRGEEYGKDRIQRNMVSNSMYPAHRMAQFVYDDLMKFMSHEMEEDVSILVMKYLDVDSGFEQESAQLPET